MAPCPKTRKTPMKPRTILSILIIALFLTPSYLSASTVFETTDRVKGIDFFRYSFTADIEPYTYQATLSDLSVGPDTGFRFLFLAVTSKRELLGYTNGPGSFLFPVDPGRKYFANIFGIGGGKSWTGDFGLKIEAVPIPPSLMLLGSGLLGLIYLRRRTR